MNTLKIVKNIGTSHEETTELSTSSFMLLYFRDGKVSIDGTIEVRDIAPALMKLMAEKIIK